jgi:hypothetical protein
MHAHTCIGITQVNEFIGMQEIPDHSKIREKLVERGLEKLDDAAKRRFLRVMKKHKYVSDDEATC